MTETTPPSELPKDQKTLKPTKNASDRKINISTKKAGEVSSEAQLRNDGESEKATPDSKPISASPAPSVRPVPETETTPSSELAKGKQGNPRVVKRREKTGQETMEENSPQTAKDVASTEEAVAGPGPQAAIVSQPVEDGGDENKKKKKHKNEDTDGDAGKHKKKKVKDGDDGEKEKNKLKGKDDDDDEKKNEGKEDGDNGDVDKNKKKKHKNEDGDGDAGKHKKKKVKDGDDDEKKNEGKEDGDNGDVDKNKKKKHKDKGEDDDAEKRKKKGKQGDDDEKKKEKKKKKKEEKERKKREKELNKAESELAGSSKPSAAIGGIINYVPTGDAGEPVTVPESEFEPHTEDGEPVKPVETEVYEGSSEESDRPPGPATYADETPSVPPPQDEEAWNGAQPASPPPRFESQHSQRLPPPRAHVGPGSKPAFKPTFAPGFFVNPTRLSGPNHGAVSPQPNQSYRPAANSPGYPSYGVAYSHTPPPSDPRHPGPRYYGDGQRYRPAPPPKYVYASSPWPHPDPRTQYEPEYGLYDDPKPSPVDGLSFGDYNKKIAEYLARLPKMSYVEGWLPSEREAAHRFAVDYANKRKQGLLV